MIIHFKEIKLQVEVKLAKMFIECHTTHHGIKNLILEEGQLRFPTSERAAVMPIWLARVLM